MTERAAFVNRDRCIACGDADLRELSSGSFGADPVRSILEGESWGVHPLPLIEHERWQFVACACCRQRFHNRILAPEWMDRLYSEWESQEAMEAFLAGRVTPESKQAHAEVAVGHVLRVLRMTQTLRGGQALRLLDYGCGWAEFVAQCRAFGVEASGIDFAPDRQTYAQVPIFESLDAWDAAQEGDARLHAATLFQVLEHLVEPRQVLEDLAARMAPGAVLILEVPDTSGVSDIRSREDFFLIAPLGHINGFTPQSLRRLAERCGFAAVQPPAAWVTASWDRALRAAAKRVLGRFRKPTTHQYFIRRA